MTGAQGVRLGVVAALAAAGLYWMNSLASLQAPSVLVYSGMACAACGILSALFPPSWTGFSKRRNGLAAGVAAGIVLFGIGWFWPAHTVSVAPPVSRLDALMPAFDFHEHHELLVQATPEKTREAFRQVSFADIGVMQTLGRIRAIAMGHVGAQPKAKGAPPSLPIVQMIQDPRSGFFPLDDSPDEFIFGLAGQPWNNKGVRLKAEDFRAWAPPGNVKIAANFRMEDAGGGRCRLVTETRVLATDDASRRKMGRYWALIYPGSGMIRRSLLEAIRLRAEAK